LSFQQGQAPRHPPQRDIELVPQVQVLEFEPSTQLEPVGDKGEEQVKQRKHCDEACADSQSYCQACEDRIFRNDSIGRLVCITVAANGGRDPSYRVMRFN
jgi:hypothetical protein